MVEVIFEEVVLREVLEVGVLDEGEIGVCEESDIHCSRCAPRIRGLCMKRVPFGSGRSQVKEYRVR